MARSVVVLAAGLLWVESALAMQAPALVAYEGTYQLSSGDYPECTNRRFIEIRQDGDGPESVGLIVVRLDDTLDDHGWQWLRFAPLDGKPRVATSDFGLIDYERFTYRNVPEGLELRHDVKSCQMRFFCGRWKRQTTMLLAGSLTRIGLLGGVASCDYRSMGIRDRR